MTVMVPDWPVAEVVTVSLTSTVLSWATVSVTPFEKVWEPLSAPPPVVKV